MKTFSEWLENIDPTRKRHKAKVIYPVIAILDNGNYISKYGAELESWDDVKSFGEEEFLIRSPAEWATLNRHMKVDGYKGRLHMIDPPSE